MCITEYFTLSKKHKSKSKNVLEINIQCLKCHKDEKIVLLETLQQQPDILSPKEIWLSENYNLDEYELQDYQPIQSPYGKNAKRRSGGVVFFLKKEIEYRPIEFESDIECYLLQVKLNTEKHDCFVSYTDQMHFK